MEQVDALLKKNDLSQAMTVSQNALRMAPEYDNALIAVADISLRMGKKAEALAAVKQAIAANPALKQQFPRNKAFAALHADPDFLQLIK
jgi:tetratricopeptide (TPR) repeat protein